MATPLAVPGVIVYAKRSGVELSLARLHTEARANLEPAGTIDELREDHIVDTVRNAVDAATKQRGARITPARRLPRRPVVR